MGLKHRLLLWGRRTYIKSFWKRRACENVWT